MRAWMHPLPTVPFGPRRHAPSGPFGSARARAPRSWWASWCFPPRPVLVPPPPMAPPRRNLRPPPPRPRHPPRGDGGGRAALRRRGDLPDHLPRPRAARAGSVVRVTGEGAGSASSIVFLGRRGPRDDRVAAARPVGPRAAEATLPAGAHGGPVRVLSADGRRSERSDREIEVRSGPRGDDLEARVATRKAFVDASNPATLDVFVGGTATAELVIDLVRPADGGVIAHLAMPAVAGGTVQSVDWDGTAGGADQPEGRYVFRCRPRPRRSARRRPPAPRRAGRPRRSTRRASCCCAAASRSWAPTATAPAPPASARVARATPTRART